MRILPLLTTVITFAAADVAGGDPKARQVAEIVTYQLKEGVSIDDAVRAAQETEAFLQETGAVISRTLSRDENGLWTDVILWTSLKAAKQTEAQAMRRPEFTRFFAMMEETSVVLRHASVLMQMD